MTQNYTIIDLTFFGSVTPVLMTSACAPWTAGQMFISKSDTVGVVKGIKTIITSESLKPSSTASTRREHFGLLGNILEKKPTLFCHILQFVAN